LYEGKFVMTTATTSSVWRSTGGDQTRTAGAGSMKMTLPFYIANAAVSANVVVSSSLANSAVILPANAVVTSVIINTTGTGTIDMGFTPLSGVGPGQTTTLGTPVPTGIFIAKSIAARSGTSTAGTGAGNSIGAVANATNLVVLTSAANGSASGTCSGWIEYFVADATYGEEAV
jgi:hypothetical protein